MGPEEKRPTRAGSYTLSQRNALKTKAKSDKSLRTKFLSPETMGQKEC